MPRSPRRPASVLACLVLSAVVAAAPAAADEAVRFLAPGDQRMNVQDSRFDWADGPARRQLNKRWYLGKQRGTQTRYGFVREGERSDFSITSKGVRFTLKF